MLLKCKCQKTGKREGAETREEKEEEKEKKQEEGTSLVVQWVRPHAPNAGGPGSIPGQGTRSHMHAATKEPTC